MTGCRPDEHCFVNTPLNPLNTPQSLYFGLCGAFFVFGFVVL